MGASTVPGRRARPRSRADRRAEAAADKAWLVYVLRCSDGTLYTGCTNDLERRLGRHQQGSVKYTRGRLPVAVLHTEEVADRGSALRREAAIKRLRREQKLRLAAAPKVG